MVDLVDGFAGTSGVDIVGRTEDPGWTTAGENYDVRISTSNGVYGTSTPAGSGRGGAKFDTGSADMFAELRLKTVSATLVGPAVRVIDKNNWVGVYLGGVGAGGLRMYKKVAGTQTILTTEQPVDESVYRLEGVYTDATNSTYELFEDGVGMLDGAKTILNSEISGTNQFSGIMNDGDNTASTINNWDDFSGGALGAGAVTGIRNPFGGPLSMRSPI